MTARTYDAIVVGARCAGSPVAMLLARQGCDVLLVDRATFPSDTISTHLVHPPGIAALRRWGVLDRLIATGCPPIGTYAFDMGPITIAGSPAMEGEPLAYAPRRTVLDALLLEAAAEAGAEVRQGFVVEDLVHEHGAVAGIRGRDARGDTVTERARVVIGADGLHSVVARRVAAPAYHEKPPLLAAYYTYWEGLPLDRFEAYDRGDRSWAAWPTHDGLTLLIVGWPYAQFEANKGDVEGAYLAALERAPEFRARVAEARRAERFAGMAVPNYFRTPYGPGWSLVGDAGYNKDFITAQGISDAFVNAERCVRALTQWYSGARSFDDAMAEYQRDRDTHSVPIYEFTCEFASFTPPTPQQQQLFAAMQGNAAAMDGFARVVAGVTSPAEFFAAANLERIMAQAGNRQPS